MYRIIHGAYSTLQSLDTMTMKILLVHPPVEDFYQTTLRTLPVGLLYLAAALRCAGSEVEILDCQATLHRHVLELPPELAYLKPYYQPGNVSPYKLFSHYRHYGLGWDEIRQRIRQAHADVIGISALFTPFYREARRVAALAKAVDPACPVIMGGAHVNACPEQVLADPHVDFVVLGEGERTLPELVHALGDTGTTSHFDRVVQKGAEVGLEEAASAVVIEAFRTQAAGKLVYGVKRPRAWTRLPCLALG